MHITAVSQEMFGSALPNVRIGRRKSYRAFLVVI